MAAKQFSSGDLIADRRADYARMLAETGDFVAAAELMEQALECVPDWTAGLARLADYCDRAGDRDRAVSALERLAERDDDGIFAARLRLAALGAQRPPARPPSRYVEALFDDYADRFEAALLGRLGYSVPQRLAALIDATAQGGGFRLAVDLGCGTGLLGSEIRAMAKRLEGFDLSTKMLAKAAEKGIYDHLGRADLALEPEASGVIGTGLQPHRADLVCAADVMMYLGDLGTVLTIAATLLAPGGLFAFSVERAGGAAGFELAPSLRYAHSDAYVAEALAGRGLQIVASEAMTLRTDGGKPVSGMLFIAGEGP